MERVLNTTDSAKNSYEQKFLKEIQDMKDRHAKEMQMSKDQLRETYEKKCEFLEQAKEENYRRVLKLE